MVGFTEAAIFVCFFACISSWLFDCGLLIIIIVSFTHRSTLMMNFDGLDPGLGEYAAGLHGGLEPGLDSTLDPALLQAVELDPDAMPVPVPVPVPVAEGMYSELHSVASEVGVPVTATHFDLHEELLWIGNHRVPNTLSYT